LIRAWSPTFKPLGRYFSFYLPNWISPWWRPAPFLRGTAVTQEVILIALERCGVDVCQKVRRCVKRRATAPKHRCLVDHPHRPRTGFGQTARQLLRHQVPRRESTRCARMEQFRSAGAFNSRRFASKAAQGVGVLPRGVVVVDGLSLTIPHHFMGMPVAFVQIGVR
jgi:hypothetical protein